MFLIATQIRHLLWANFDIYKMAEAKPIDFSQMRKPTRKRDRKEEKKDQPQEAATSGPIDAQYLEMLDRIYGILQTSRGKSMNPSANQSVAIAPAVSRQGTKKTCFSNFADVCAHLKRKEKHLQDYISTELGSQTSLAGGSQLILKGRFMDKQIEHVLRGYITEYVSCHMCGNLSTLLVKDKQTRAYEMQCINCNSIRSVKAIKGGFVATAKGDRRKAKANT